MARHERTFVAKANPGGTAEQSVPVVGTVFYLGGLFMFEKVSTDLNFVKREEEVLKVLEGAGHL